MKDIPVLDYQIGIQNHTPYELIGRIEKVTKNEIPTYIIHIMMKESTNA